MPRLLALSKAPELMAGARWQHNSQASSQGIAQLGLGFFPLQGFLVLSKTKESRSADHIDWHAGRLS
jgi:hypothetical protein